MENRKQNFTGPFVIMCFLLFLLGFITWMNGILVPFLKDLYGLSHGTSQLVNAAFFSAYIISIPVGGFVKKIGYKKSVIIGSMITGIGCLLFAPAVIVGFGMFLVALFITALGIVVLQVSANPYIIILGSPETSSSRLTFAMATNSLAAVVTPIIGTTFILSRVINNPVSDAHLAQTPYLIMGSVAFVTGLILIFLKLPEIQNDEKTETFSHRSAWSYPHLILGFVAIGVYMGLEVGVNTFFIKYAQLKVGLAEGEVGIYMAMYPFCYLVGRLGGAGLLKKIAPGKVLATFSLIGAAMIAISINTTGYISLYALIATGLFHSIMWSVIFDLALKDVVPDAVKLGSGILCTGVIFTGAWTWIMGSVAENTSIPSAYSLLFVFYAFIIFYALAGSKIRKAST